MNNRLFLLNNNKKHKGDSIVYWMSREQRIDDNWAVIYALKRAASENVPLKIIFVFSFVLYGNRLRAISFMLEGLKETEKRAKELGISFNVFCSDTPAKTVEKFSKEVNASAIICDFNPLKESFNEHDNLAKSINIPMIEIDSHNIIPCRYISQKQEYGAYTLRRKIEKVLPTFLISIPNVESLLKNYKNIFYNEQSNNWKHIENYLCLEGEKANKNYIIPGYSNGMKQMKTFLYEKLSNYSINRNNPNIEAQSGLSFHLHFGQISSQVVALAASIFLGNANLKGGFLDEIIVRKELSDNFCLYNQNYDNFCGFPNWAKNSLMLHTIDEREYIYNFDEFKKANTHDLLWNAAQTQLKKEGRIHGYMRMYWAKKILEWSKNPATAMNIAVRLNDSYAIDGRDTNGYAGCAWSIGGLHDRSWTERKIFGKIRFMNERGCRRKFDVDKYISRVC